MTTSRRVSVPNLFPMFKSGSTLAIPTVLPGMLFVVLVAMLFVVSACGAGAATDDDAGADDRDASAAAPAAERSSGSGGPDRRVVPVISSDCPVTNPAAEVVVDVVGWDAPPAADFVNALGHCGAGNYRINPLHLERADALAVLALDAGTGAPEIELYQGPTGFLTDLARAGALAPIGDLIDEHAEEYGLDRIDPSVWASVSVDGERYAIPVAPADDDLVAGSVPVLDHGFAVAAVTTGNGEADREAVFLALVAAYGATSG